MGNLSQAREYLDWAMSLVNEAIKQRPSEISKTIAWSLTQEIARIKLEEEKQGVKIITAGPEVANPKG